MVAFAGNSVLTRLALGRATIDAATFSTVRIAGGAGMLLATTALRESGRVRLTGSWVSAAVLFLYAIPFSFAYNSLTAGTGALILFGVVQVTMMVAAVRSGERPHRLQWVGLALASGGLVYLVLPGLKAPSLSGSLLMALAGIMWGIYSLRGRGSANPLQLNMSNFVRALPLVIVVSLLARGHAYTTVERTLARARVRRDHVRTRVRAVVHGAPTSHRHARGDRAVDGADSRQCRRCRVSG